jgi:hypothetical protein
MKGNRWKLGMLVLAYAIAVVLLQNETARMFLAEIPGLGLLTPEQLDQFGIVIGGFVLIPIVILPIFLSVRRRFIRNGVTLRKQIAKTMGRKKSWDGTYRLHPFYCYDDLWRPAVQDMMRDAEAVLMDFRGFDPSKKGCQFEITKVLDTVAIERVVLLIDEETDQETMFQLFRDGWSRLEVDSPNCDTSDPTLKVFTARTILTWRDGIARWLLSLPWRQARWHEDAERTLGFLVSGTDDEVSLRIPRVSIPEERQQQVGPSAKRNIELAPFDWGSISNEN